MSVSRPGRNEIASSSFAIATGRLTISITSLQYIIHSALVPSSPIRRTGFIRPPSLKFFFKLFVENMFTIFHARQSILKSVFIKPHPMQIIYRPFSSPFFGHAKYQAVPHKCSAEVEWYPHCHHTHSARPHPLTNQHCHHHNILTHFPS